MTNERLKEPERQRANVIWGRVQHVNEVVVLCFAVVTLTCIFDCSNLPFARLAACLVSNEPQPAENVYL